MTSDSWKCFRGKGSTYKQQMTSLLPYVGNGHAPLLQQADSEPLDMLRLLDFILFILFLAFLVFPFLFFLCGLFIFFLKSVKEGTLDTPRE